MKLYSLTEHRTILALLTPNQESYIRVLKTLAMFMGEVIFAASDRPVKRVREHKEGHIIFIILTHC